MKRNLLLKCICLVLIIAGNSYGQTYKYSKAYNHSGAGQDNANAICATYDNCNFIVGSVDSNPVLIKMDSAGVPMFSKQFVNTASKFTVITPTNDSCYMLGGILYNTSTGKQNMYLVKVNILGDTIWTKAITQTNNATIYSIQQTADSGYVMTGCITSMTVAPYTTVFVTKTDSLGNVEWNQKFVSGTKENIGRSVKQTPDGGYAVLFSFQMTSVTNDRLVLMKLDMNGIIQWSNEYYSTISTFYSYSANDLSVTPSGITVHYRTNYDLAFFKTDYTGTILWDRAYYSPWGAYSSIYYGLPKMLVTKNGGYIAISGEEGCDCYSIAIKIDSIGNIVFVKELEFNAMGVSESKDNGYTFLGSGSLIAVGRNPSSIYSEIGLIKTDTLGNGITCLFPASSNVDTLNLLPASLSPSVTGGGTTTYKKGISILTPSLLYNNGCILIWGGIDENSLSNVSIYPNPTASDFTISGLQGECNIEIYDAMGKSIFATSTSDEKINLHLNNYSKGIYFYRVTTKDHSINQGKISLQ